VGSGQQSRRLTKHPYIHEQAVRDSAAALLLVALIETIASIVNDVMDAFLTLFRVGIGDDQQRSQSAAYGISLYSFL
jgi:hypothetical protein